MSDCFQSDTSGRQRLALGGTESVGAAARGATSVGAAATGATSVGAGKSPAQRAQNNQRIGEGFIADLSPQL